MNSGHCGAGVVLLFLCASGASAQVPVDTVPAASVFGDTVEAAARARAAARREIVASYMIAGMIAGPAAVASFTTVLTGADLQPWHSAGPVAMGALIHRASRDNLPLRPELAAQIEGADDAYAEVYRRTYDAAVKRRRRAALGLGAVLGTLGGILILRNINYT